MKMNKGDKDLLQLCVEDVKIKLPPNTLLVKEDNYKLLQQKNKSGSVLSFNDVLKLLGVSRPWLLKNILYNPKYKKIIDIKNNPQNGFVSYPRNKGGRYYFLESKTKEFFEENFAEVFQQ